VVPVSLNRACRFESTSTVPGRFELCLAQQATEEGATRSETRSYASKPH